MPNPMQSYFWMPEETVDWLTHAVLSFDLRLIEWEVGTDAEPTDVGRLDAKRLYGREEESVQFFLGVSGISSESPWRQAGGRRVIDFQSAYVVQLVPSVVAPDCAALLEGRLAVFAASQYQDGDRAAKLLALFNGLRSSMRDHSDRSRRVVQVLENGERKAWKQILVGPQVPSDNKLPLRQFLRGKVDFVTEAAD